MKFSQVLWVVWLVWTWDQIKVVFATRKDASHLEELLQKVAGVYVDPEKQHGFEKTVVITACNHGFVNHLHNFNCYAKRLGFKFIVFAMDEILHRYLTENTTMISYHMNGGTVGDVTHESTEFRSRQFNLITAKKKESVHEVLMLGYSVFFTDTDVAMLVDPFPNFIWKNVDYVHSANMVCSKDYGWDFFRHSRLEGNTGFYYVNNNNKTIQLWQTAYEVSLRTPNLDDQAVFWHVARTSKSPSVTHIGKCRPYHYSSPSESSHLIACMLDNCEFSAGMLSRAWVPEFTYEELVSQVQARNGTIRAIHANYIKGNKGKMEKLHQHGLWLAIPYLESENPESSSIQYILDELHGNLTASMDSVSNNFSHQNYSKDDRNAALRSLTMVRNVSYSWNSLELSKIRWSEQCLEFRGSY